LPFKKIDFHRNSDTRLLFARAKKMRSFYTSSFHALPSEFLCHFLLSWMSVCNKCPKKSSKHSVVVHECSHIHTQYYTLPTQLSINTHIIQCRTHFENFQLHFHHHINVHTYTNIQRFWAVQHGAKWTRSKLLLICITIFFMWWLMNN
jgi:hypothetical protein